MISVAEAFKRLDETVFSLNECEQISLSVANGRVLFEDVISPINMPPFRQSAMDGYALAMDRFNYKVVGEVQAGSYFLRELKKGEAVRIFTGAKVPDSAQAVVMQEKVMRTEDLITIQELPKFEENIRPKGEQVQKGILALEKGTKLNPASIGFLSSLGLTQVIVFRKPKVAIITTGNELVIPGEELKDGKIYESNSIMLKSAIASSCHCDADLFTIADNYDQTEQLFRKLILKYDLIIASGGISVGDYDFVGKALRNIGVEEVFYKVKQKPGKPLFFGRNDETLIFALPGNPAAALTCFYVYVMKTIHSLEGATSDSLIRTKARLINSFTKKGNRAQFLKAIFNNEEVTILEGQSSAMLHTFGFANALVYVGEQENHLREGDKVNVLLLPI